MSKPLTTAEEQLMQVLWSLEAATVQEIIDQLPNPKPAYNTVSTIIRILESKEFVNHKPKGRGYIYYPLIKKADYSSQALNKFVDGYFGGSFKNMVSFFVRKNDIDIDELEEIIQKLNNSK